MALSLADKIEMAMAKVKEGQQGLTTDDDTQPERGLSSATDATDPWQAHGSRSGYESHASRQNGGVSGNASLTPTEPAELEPSPQPSLELESATLQTEQPLDTADSEMGTWTAEKATAPSASATDVVGNALQDPHATPSERSGAKQNLHAASTTRERVAARAAAARRAAAQSSSGNDREGGKDAPAEQNAFEAAKQKLAERRRATSAPRVRPEENGGGGGGGGADATMARKLAQARATAAQQQDRRAASVSRATSRGRRLDSGSSEESGGAATPRGHLLYQRAVESRQKLQRQREAHRDPEATHQPQLFTRRTPSRPRGAAGADAAGAAHTPGTPSRSRFDALYESARARQARHEERQKAPDPRSTFKPAITKKAQEARSSAQRFDLLYAAAQTRQQRLGETAEKVRALEGCTHTPAITNRARSVNRGDARKPEERLYVKPETQAETAARLKREKEQRELQDCTFSPILVAKQVAAREASDLGSVGSDGRPRVETRMQEYEELRQAKLEALRREHVEKELAEMRPPDIGRSQQRCQSPKHGGRTEPEEPIYERLTKEQLRRVDSSLQRELAAKNDATCTFRPKINKRSASAARARVQRRSAANSTADLEAEEVLGAKGAGTGARGGGGRGERRSVSTGRGAVLRGETVYDRLYHDVVGDKEKVAALAKELADREVAECSFTPKRHSSPPRARSRPRGAAADGEGEELAGAAAAATRGGREASAAADAPVWQRLSDRVSTEALAANEQRRRERQAELELAGCTFAPKIKARPTPQRDERRAAGVPVHERLQAAQQDFASRAKLRESHELQGCTFQPEVRGLLHKGSAASLEGGGGGGDERAGSIFERLAVEAEDRRRRGAAMEQLRAERETETCTFRPEVKGFRGGLAEKSELARQSAAERLLRPVEPYMKRAEIEARWRMEQEFRERHARDAAATRMGPGHGTGRSQSARPQRPAAAADSPRSAAAGGAGGAGQARPGAAAANGGSSMSRAERRAASASRAAVSSRKSTTAAGGGAAAAGSTGQGAAADFDKWQASIEQQINKL